MAIQEVKLPEWYWKHISADNTWIIARFTKLGKTSIAFDKRLFYNGAEKALTSDDSTSVVGKRIVANTYNPMSKFPWEMTHYMIKGIFTT